MSNTIKVSDISASTDEKKLRDFFTFCGKISKIELEGSGESKAATITFEKSTAASTALLLNNTALENQVLKVEIVKGEESGNGTASPVGGELRQEDKPRAAIFAEMLAHGYSLTDAVLERGIDFDKKNGISDRLLHYLKSLDQKYKVSDNISHANDAYHVTDTFTSWYTYVFNYFNQTLETPTGKKVRNAYDVTAVRVKDIHETAKEIQKKKNGGASKSGVTASTLESVVASVQSTATPEKKD